MEIYDSLMAIYDKIILCLHWLKFMTISQREAQIHLWSFIASLIEIYDHFQREAQNHSWTFMSSLIEIYDHFQREAQIHLWAFMVSLMIIFDQKKREAQNRRTFMTSLMIIFDPKKRVIDDKKNFCLIYDHSPARSANSFMTIYDFIDDYFWPKKSAERKTNISLISFLTKNPRSAKPKTIYIIFDKKEPFKSRIHE